MKTYSARSALIAAVALLALGLSVQPSIALAQSGGHGGHVAGGHSGGGAHGGGGFRGGGHAPAGRAFAGRPGAPRYGFAARSQAFRGNLGAPRVAIGRGHFDARASYGTRGVGPRFAGGRGYHWRGGYWGGRYWPGVFFGASFLWFMPVLPGYCPVYWWNDVPYYYYDNAYYTWDSDQSGYIATAPPPAAADDDSGATSDAGAGDVDAAPPSDANLYAYPKNGQNSQQQTQDRQACEQWAGSQTNGGAHVGANGAADDASAPSVDYQRALTACLTGRGYSVD